MIIRIFIFVCFVLFVSSTWASELCLHLDPKTLCTAPDSQSNCTWCADITVYCDGVGVWLMGQCASTTGTDGTTRENLSLAENNGDLTNTDNRQCWCMMVWPISSQWVWRYTYKDNNTCIARCALGCRDGFMLDNTEDITFREAVFNTLIK